MGRPDGRRRLVVNADDFGRSPGINAAVQRAHRDGVLTTASLMVNEPACREAVAWARDHPTLGVGLHLALLCGQAALPHQSIPRLTNQRGAFSAGPVRAGLRFFGRRGLRAQLRAEIEAQFARFAATGLPLDHLNGHLHLHLHPVVFDLLTEHAAEWPMPIERIRLTRDPFFLNARLAPGRWGYRASHALIHHFLSRRAAPALRARGWRHTERVFGLLQDSRVDESYVLNLLAQLPPGDSELYSHPSLDEFPHELAALISPRVRATLEERNIQLIRYADL
jgi:hopanoid biosynthesis associated protein HpnK